MRFTALLPGLLLIALSLPHPVATNQDAQHEYVGSQQCRKCHIREFRSWEQTKMANVFDLLKPGVRSEQKVAAGLDPDKDYTKDAECLPCHTVGYGKPGGFVDLDKTPNHAGVGCEACHGPGGTYLKDGYMTLQNNQYKKEELVAVGLVDTVSAAQCTTCHNEDSPFVEESFVFDFAANKELGTHEKYPLKFQH